MLAAEQDAEATPEQVALAGLIAARLALEFPGSETAIGRAVVSASAEILGLYLDHTTARECCRDTAHNLLTTAALAGERLTRQHPEGAAT